VISNYFRISREPRYSLTFALPLLVAYEVLASSLSGSEFAGVRNGADVLLKSLFVALGGRFGLVFFGALLVVAGSYLAWRNRGAGRLKGGVLAAMAAESALYAVCFGVVTGTLTRLVLPGLALVGDTPNLLLQFGRWALPTQLMISLGAGIYEELLFRVLLVSGLAWLARAAFARSRTVANVFAVIVGALIFSAFHYIGPYGDRLELGSFTFRAIAGLLFSGLYVLRGFGITAWTHALYDVLLVVGA